jgi:ubiquinone biosynthesis protein
LAHYKGFSRPLKTRQQEVEQRLAQFGLRAGPRRVIRNGVSSEHNKIGRLREALENLGPIFCCFGRYVSTRADLLAASDSFQLASINDQAPALPPAVLQDHIKRELGCCPDEIYREFDEKPFVSGLLVQQHCAWLRDGTPVTVRLVRPEVEELIYYDTQLLHLLQGALMSSDCTSDQIKSAINDFVLMLQQSTNFLLQADALSRFSKDMVAFGMLRVPLVESQLTTTKMLTIERLPGQTLEQLLNVRSNEYSHQISDDERNTLAHRLYVVWLRQSLRGTVFPVEPTPANIAILPTNQIAFTAGPLTSLPTQAKAHFWDYLVAALADDPDQACSALMKEMDVRDQSISEVELRRRFRQQVPFRDSNCVYGGDNNGLDENLFMHWRLAQRSGYEPRAHVTSFYRGLFMMAGICRRLTSKEDLLFNALQDVRVLAETENLRALLSSSRFVEEMDAYLELMMHLPQRLDRALSLGTSVDRRRSPQIPNISETRRRKNSLAVDVALWLMLVATLLLVQNSRIGFAGFREVRLETLVFILFGALLLLSVGRRY